MQLAVALACLAATLAVANSRLCRTSEDCSATRECCVARSMRQLRDRGTCRILPRSGRPCGTEDDQISNFGDKFLSNCPCDDGLTCESNRGFLETDRRYRASLRCRAEDDSTTGGSEGGNAPENNDDDEEEEETTGDEGTE